MKAAVLHQPGSAPVVGEFREPTAATAGVEVAEVLAAGLNPVDIVTAARAATPLPAVAGREGVARLPDGRRVYFDKPAAPFGSLAEKVPVDVAASFELPDTLDSGLATALGVAGLAAWLPLTWRGRLQPGERVLVLGATGVVGQIAVQGAKLLGAGHVVAVGRNAQRLERTRDIGADETVPLGDDFDARLRDAAGDGFDLVIDAVYGPPLESALQVTAEGARVVIVGTNAGDRIRVPFMALLNRELIGHTNFGTPEPVRREAFAAMARHAVAGELEVEIEHFALDDASTAWQRQITGPNRKLVITPTTEPT